MGFHGKMRLMPYKEPGLKKLYDKANRSSATRREQLRRSQATWRAKNKAYKAFLQARRHAAKLRATPSWADDDKIAQFYCLRETMEKIFGRKYCVDHIVPLKSSLVCGMHVENNLQVISYRENALKGNWRWPQMPE